MAAECAAAVVVFAVYIVRDGTADGYEFGARCHRQKPAAWYEDVEDFRQRDACFATQEACFLVEGDEASEVCEVECDAVFVETAIAIAAAIGIGEYGLLVCCEVGQFVLPVDGLYLAVLYFWVSAP